MLRLIPVVMAMLLPFASQGTLRSISLAGREQKLHLYGPAAGAPVILSSGDGGWVHLAPHLAEWLAARGYFVIGFDVKAYLASATNGATTLTRSEVERDYGTLLTTFAHQRPAILAGISEGAGLSVLAAARADNKPRLAGVLAVSLGERNELGWRWKDSIIYVTHGVPDEPTFNAAAFMPLVTPAPLAMIRPSRDDFVPRAESDRLIAAAAPPSRAWTVPASDHRFSDNPGGFDSAVAAALEWMHTAVP